MKYNEIELKKLMKKDIDALSVDEQISINIFNFIRTIHLNKQDFYSAVFATQYFGDIEMTFKKEANCLIGHCSININEEGKMREYLFTENGFELLQDVVYK